MPRLFIGEILVKEGMLSEEQLEKAILTQKREGGRIGDILIKMGYVKEVDVIRTVSKQLNIPFASETNTQILTPAQDETL